ncbi:hypothetical protein GOODEAATRI_034282 [Goodea atripinnis]|uniref:Uncharacterized protein n=1 Tax=Goodea atripinnis TaxID=208336 RepID=A0ABV0P075_9TELE
MKILYPTLGATLLDPRFKSLRFRSSSKCNEAINKFWEHLDIKVGRQTKSATADAIQEVQRCLAEGNIARSQVPMRY